MYRLDLMSIGAYWLQLFCGRDLQKTAHYVVNLSPTKTDWCGAQQ